MIGEIGLRHYIRNIDSLENVVVSKVGQQLDLYRPSVVEKVLDVGYKLHVLDWNEGVTDLPEYTHWKGKKFRGLPYDSFSGWAGDHITKKPTVVSIHFLHPEGEGIEIMPNMLVHEIGHSLPGLFFNLSQWSQLAYLHNRAFKSGYVHDIPQMMYPQEYLAVGVECTAQKEPPKPMIKTRLFGPKGQVISNIFTKLPRNADTIRRADPELYSVCRQFLKEDAGK